MNRYVVGHPQSEAPLSLFCFHHAGAGAMTFARWRQRLGPQVRVLPVRLPGRETRLREARITDGNRLMRELAEALGSLLDQPHAFYGHSMGALVAYRFALHRVREGHRAPDSVLVGACSPPHLPGRFTDGDELPDQELLGLLSRCGDLPEYLVQRPERLRTLLATLRDDLQLARSLRDGSGDALPCPLRAFAGRDDTVAPAGEMRSWDQYTTAAFELRTIAGGHFFVRGGELSQLLASALGSGSPSRLAGLNT
ncbi:thioesterase II family protein [Streptomyces sp. NBC_01618]|uniref:thioesterase II family protein n=1 Tax=Streptomyces sp. NBC_01618 TaxID=2975900 RepID=UPI0038688116|nr:alpha/beta fold hydrolase [Streptomyces sp. NBC_01618]